MEYLTQHAFSVPKTVNAQTERIFFSHNRVKNFTNVVRTSYIRPNTAYQQGLHSTCLHSDVIQQVAVQDFSPKLTATMKCKGRQLSFFLSATPFLIRGITEIWEDVFYFIGGIYTLSFTR